MYYLLLSFTISNATSPCTSIYEKKKVKYFMYIILYRLVICVHTWIICESDGGGKCSEAYHLQKFLVCDDDDMIPKSVRTTYNNQGKWWGWW